MRVGSFGLGISSGVERESGYVRIPHDTPYGVMLVSYNHSPADVEVTIDGRPIGTYRLDPQTRITIETPHDDPDHGRFTFYRADSEEGDVAGSGTEAPERGLVRAVFKPGRLKYVSRPFRGYPSSTWRRPLHELQTDILRSMIEKDDSRVTLCSMNSTSRAPSDVSETITSGPGIDATPGVTGLSGQSDQRFVNADPIDHYPDKEVTITLRLVAVSKGQAVRPIPPAPARANPVPPPV